MATTPADPCIPPEYANCATIVSSVGKLWILPYILIIFYQLCACYKVTLQFLALMMFIKSNSYLDTDRDISSISFYPALWPVFALVHAPD